ncbi:MAG: winged helix-turn-helix transcriptional regulator [Candidatus Verstraetearchaeota archaeon]|nr:winged helix-turn-helix transcriptional regulator [Candidatus Verstraetearchaeota archaeon]
MGIYLQQENRISRLLKKYIRSEVEVYLLDGRVIKGKLVQIDEENMDLFLEDCIDSEGKSSPATVIMGGSILYINILSPPSKETLEDKILRILANNSNITIAEIAKILNIKPSSVRSAISRLRKKGLLPSNETTIEKDK